MTAVQIAHSLNSRHIINVMYLPTGYTSITAAGVSYVLIFTPIPPQLFVERQPTREEIRLGFVWAGGRFKTKVVGPESSFCCCLVWDIRDSLECSVKRNYDFAV